MRYIYVQEVVTFFKSYYIRWVTTSWTHSIIYNFWQVIVRHVRSPWFVTARAGSPTTCCPASRQPQPVGTRVAKSSLVVAIIALKGKINYNIFQLNLTIKVVLLISFMMIPLRILGFLSKKNPDPILMTGRIIVIL